MKLRLVFPHRTKCLNNNSKGITRKVLMLLWCISSNSLMGKPHFSNNLISKISSKGGNNRNHHHMISNNNNLNGHHLARTKKKIRMIRMNHYKMSGHPNPNPLLNNNEDHLNPQNKNQLFGQVNNNKSSRSGPLLAVHKLHHLTTVGLKI